MLVVVARCTPSGRPTTPPAPPALPPLCSGTILIQAVTAASLVPDMCTFCRGPLAQPLLQRHTRWLYQVLDVSLLSPWGSAVHALETTQSGNASTVQCCTVLTWSLVACGVLLPALLQAGRACQLFRVHQGQRRGAGLPPERGWHAAGYSVGALLWPRGGAPGSDCIWCAGLCMGLEHAACRWLRVSCRHRAPLSTLHDAHARRCSSRAHYGLHPLPCTPKSPKSLVVARM